MPSIDLRLWVSLGRHSVQVNECENEGLLCAGYMLKASHGEVRVSPALEEPTQSNCPKEETARRDVRFVGEITQGAAELGRSQVWFLD